MKEQIMKNKSVPQSVLICLFIALAFAVYNPPARADSTTWTNLSTGDWFTGANWSNGVPDCMKDASVNNAGKAQINSSGATALSLTLGLNAGQSGSASVDGTNSGNLTVGNCSSAVGDIYIGSQGSGTMSITNGGRVSSGNGYIAALRGELTISNGSVTVSGGSEWEVNTGGRAVVFVGAGPGGPDGGTGLLTVADGGEVTVHNWAANTAAVLVGSSGTLTGNGTIKTSVSVSPITAVRGTLVPTGTLTIEGILGLLSGATTVCDVTPQGADMVHVLGGSAALDGRLSVTMTGTFTPGTQFILLHADGGRFGTFLGGVSIKYSPDPRFTPVITYDANNVYLNLQTNEGP